MTTEEDIKRLNFHHNAETGRDQPEPHEDREEAIAILDAAMKASIDDTAKDFMDTVGRKAAMFDELVDRLEIVLDSLGALSNASELTDRIGVHEARNVYVTLHKARDLQKRESNG